MYKLASGDINNAKYLAISEEVIPTHVANYSKMSLTEIKTILFAEEIDEARYENISLLLTLGDELLTPIRHREAQDLYYILQANYAFYSGETDIKLTSYPQALLFIDLTERNHKDLSRLIDPTKKVRYASFLARHSCLFPECSILWKIPISFYKDGNTGKTMCTLAAVNANPYALVSIPAMGIKDVKIPKQAYIPFFKESMSGGKIAVEADTNTHALKECFDERLVEPVLTIIGILDLQEYHRIVKHPGTEYFYSEDNNALIAHLQSKDSDVEESMPDEDRILWHKLGYSEYRFLRPGATYLPIKTSAEVISVYK